jgi:hypothetical protein
LQTRKVVRASTDSASRVFKDRADVAGSMDTATVARNIGSVTNPKSPRSTMRKAGIALIAAPDPVTTVAGVGLLASSFALKKDPANLEHLALETKKILHDLGSLSV